MPEHWLTFVYQYGLGGTFFAFTTFLAVRAGVLNLKANNGKIIFALIVDGFLLFMGMHALWIYLVAGNFLFKVDLEYAATLERGKISSALQQEFDANHAPLSTQARVEKKEKNWLVTDPQSQQSYRLEKDENPFEKEYLFSMDLQYKKDLIGDQVPAQIRQLFRDYSGIDLPENSSLRNIGDKITNKKMWQITAGGHQGKYLIVAIDTLPVFNVYKIGKYSLLVYRCQSQGNNVVWTIVACVGLAMLGHAFWLYRSTRSQ